MIKRTTIPPPCVMNQPLSITLKREVWMALLFAARQLAKKRKRDAKNQPPFTPEPGKRNSATEQIRKLNEAIDVISEVLGEP